MPDKYYLNKLYPLQDRVLDVLREDLGPFYVTGGTVLGRFYLEHRYSDDLDVFCNDYDHFQDHVNRLLELLRQNGYTLELGTVTNTFLRCWVQTVEVSLKLDFVNDIAYRVAKPMEHDSLVRVDHWMNILVNKLYAITRAELKDIADIHALSRRYPFHWREIVEHARCKDAWVEPLAICRILDSAPIFELEHIHWINPVEPEQVQEDLNMIRDDIFYGRENQLAQDGE